jgi:hypothetical protein
VISRNCSSRWNLGCIAYRGSAWAIAACGFACLTTACQGRQGAPIPNPSTSKSLIAQRCERLNPDRMSTGESFARVFVDGFDVVSEDLQTPLGPWLAEHPIEVHHSQAMMLTHDTPSSASWNRCANRSCTATELWNITITPRLPKRASDPLQLTVELRSAAASTEQRGSSSTVEARDQYPVRIDFPGARSTGATAMVLAPYLVNNDEDLRAIMLCKEQQAASAHEARVGVAPESASTSGS